MDSLVAQPRATPWREGPPCRACGRPRGADFVRPAWPAWPSGARSASASASAAAFRRRFRGSHGRGSAAHRAPKLWAAAAAGFAVASRKRAAKPAPKQGFAREAKFRTWLKQSGCKGIDLVEVGKKSGIWLKSDLTSEEEAAVREGMIILEVPPQAWISADPESSEADVEELLAAELLKERAKGPTSSFAPYVDFLWRRDLSHHPMFWKPEELSWLSPCDGAQAAVLSLQEQTKQRLARLQQRLGSVPEEDIRFALCLVETRAIQTKGICGALVPLLDHLRNDSTASPALIVGDDAGLVGDPMVGVALHDLEPGSELRNCFEPVSNVELFTQYGEVQIRDVSGTDEAVPEANAFNYVQLPVKALPEHWRASSESLKKVKLKILRRRAGLDLDLSRESGLTPEPLSRMRLPMDAMVTGRMLPAARFICWPVPPKDMEELCEQHFKKLFVDCDPSLLPGSDLEWGTSSASSSQPPATAEELALEVKARVLVAEWFETSLRGYNKMSEKIAQELEEATMTSPASPSRDGSEPRLAEVTEAYYKAKRKDGSRGKSRAPKLCRVLSARPDDSTIIVQFLENGVRHTIPEAWLVRKADKGSAGDTQQGEAAAHRARGLLAMALLGSQSSIVQACYEMLLNVLQIGQGILDCKHEKERRSLVQELRQAWQQEQDMLLQCQSDKQDPD